MSHDRASHTPTRSDAPATSAPRSQPPAPSREPDRAPPTEERLPTTRDRLAERLVAGGSSPEDRPPSSRERLTRDLSAGARSAGTPAIYLDRAPGASGSSRPTAAVDRALSSPGRGESHPTGARLHTGPAAAQAAESLGARAFTAGRDIFFGGGEYQPGSESGQSLLRHELTHVEQSRDQPAPRPGNYRIADAGEGAEVAARASEGGGGAAGTGEGRSIYLSPKAQKAFHDAIDSAKSNDARKAWDKMSGKERKTSTSKEIDALDAGRAATLMDMKAAWKSFRGFIPAEPDANQVGKLYVFVSTTTSKAEAAGIFKRAYASRLHDKSYDSSNLKTAPWELTYIQKLYSTLNQYLPAAHVRSNFSGFYLGSQIKDGGKWGNLGYGYFWKGFTVMPLNSTKAAAGGGGSVGHGMVGGTTSATAGTPLTHFAATLLHEIGHAVGATSGYNAWGTGYGEWKGIGLGPWSKALFDDAAAQGVVDAAKLKKVLSPARARNYMAHAIGKTSYKVKGWKEADIKTFIGTHYTAEKLYTYWNDVVVGGKAEYKVDAATNAVGGKVYVWLSRFSNQFTTYKDGLLAGKVSWYSMSSPLEWFAEQYSHYYNSGKAHGDATVKDKLDKLDTGTWKAKKKKFKASKGGEGGDTVGASAGAEAPSAAEFERTRLPFGW